MLSIKRNTGIIYLLDFILIAVIWLIIGAAVINLFGDLFEQFWKIVFLFMVFLFIALHLLFHVIFTVKFGATVGLMIFGFVVVDRYKNNISYDLALKRAIFIIFFFWDPYEERSKISVVKRSSLSNTFQTPDNDKNKCGEKNSCVLDNQRKNIISCLHCKSEIGKCLIRCPVCSRLQINQRERERLVLSIICLTILIWLFLKDVFSRLFPY